MPTKKRHQRPHRHGLQTVLDRRGETLDDLADRVEGLRVVIEQVVNAAINPRANWNDFRHGNLGGA
ncbi:hypothetical protein OKW39_008718 [Paraburkholderia sp. MM6662-R1]